jgi:hypothetical protein
MLTALLPALALGLDIGKIVSTNYDTPSGRLVHASRMGNFPAVRRCFLDHDVGELDLDSALDAACAHAHMEIVDLLVRFGAKDLDSALLSASARDHVKIVAYLVSSERHNPATNTREAQTLASNLGAFNCDWFLTAHRWKEHRSL